MKTWVLLSLAAMGVLGTPVYPCSDNLLDAPEVTQTGKLPLAHSGVHEFYVTRNYDRLVPLIERRLHQFFKGRAGDWEEDDIIQGILVDLLHSHDKYSGTCDGDFSKYLHTVAKNKLADHLRKAYSNGEVMSVTPSDFPRFRRQGLADYSRADRFAAPAECQLEELSFEGLSTRQKTLLGRLLLEGLTREEVAFSLGMNEATLDEEYEEALGKLRGAHLNDLPRHLFFTREQFNRLLSLMVPDERTALTPENIRRIVELRIVQGVQNKHIAKELGVSEAAVAHYIFEFSSKLSNVAGKRIEAGNVFVIEEGTNNARFRHAVSPEQMRAFLSDLPSLTSVEKTVAGLYYLDGLESADIAKRRNVQKSTIDATLDRFAKTLMGSGKLSLSSARDLAVLPDGRVPGYFERPLMTAALDQGAVQMAVGSVKKGGGLQHLTLSESKLRKALDETTLSARDRGIIEAYLVIPRKPVAAIAEQYGLSESATSAAISNAVRAMTPRLSRWSKLTANNLQVIPDRFWDSPEALAPSERPPFLDTDLELPEEWVKPRGEAKLAMTVALFQKTLQNLSSLTAPTKSILEKHFIEGLSSGELAAKLGGTAGGMRKLLNAWVTKIGAEHSVLLARAEELHVVTAAEIARARQYEVNRVGPGVYGFTPETFSRAVVEAETSDEVKGLLLGRYLLGRTVKSLAEELTQSEQAVSVKIKRGVARVAEAMGIEELRTFQITEAIPSAPLPLAGENLRQERLNAGVMTLQEFNYALSGFGDETKGRKLRMAMRLWFVHGFSQGRIAEALEIDKDTTLNHYLWSGSKLLGEVMGHPEWSRARIVVMPAAP